MSNEAPKVCHMNDVAQHYLDTYLRGGEVDGGWKFAKALQQTQLDYSDGSLGRLDRLLASIRERAKPSREVLQESVSGRNFCSLISYYVIEVVRHRTGAHIVWHDRASALRALPAGAQLPDAPFARLIALSDDHGAAFMPLGWVEAQVLGNGRQATAGDCIADLIAQLERDGPVVWWTGTHALGRIASWQILTAPLSKPRLFQTGAIPMPASRFPCEHLHQNLFWACTSRIHAQVPVVTTGKLTETLRQQIPCGIDVTVVAGPTFRTAPLPLI